MGKGHCYLGQPVAFQPMGYPFFLGNFYILMEDNNIILSLITLIIVLRILFKIYDNKKTIFLTYIIITFLPNHIFYNNVLGSEILITLLLAIIIYLQLCNFNNKFRYGLIGIFIGLATLTKPFFILYPIVVAVVQWLKNKNIKETSKIFFASFSITCLIVAPWAYRNYKNFNLLIPVSYNGGYVLFINNNSDNKNGAWMQIADIHTSQKVKNQFKKYDFNYKNNAENEVSQVMLKPELNNLFKKQAEKWIVNHPIDFGELGIKRMKNTFFNGAGDIYQWGMNNNKMENRNSFLKSEFMINNTNSFIYILSFFGFFYVIYNFKSILISFFKKKPTIDYIKSILFFNISYFIAITFVFEGQQRYNFPILFLCTIK